MRGKYDRLASGEDLRPAVGHFARVQFRERHAPPAGRRHPPESSSAGTVDRRDDIAVIAPAGAVRIGCVAQWDGGTTFHGNFLKLAVGEKADPFSVRREER